MSVFDNTRWRLLLPSRSHDLDPAFRSVLTRVLRTGLRQIGTIGLVASLLYLGLSVFGLGYDLTWTYDAVVSGGTNQQIVLAGIIIGAALSVIGLVLSQSVSSLRTGRLFGWAAILMAGAVATFEGAVRGVFSTEYVILIYLLVITIIPFRPAQVVGIGASIAVVVYLLGPTGLAWEGTVAFSSGMAKHLSFIVGASILVSVASIALYVRHESFGKTQASLQKNRDLLRRTQEVAQVGGWEYDLENDTVKGTEELYAILDLPEGTRFALDTWLSFYPAGTREKVQQAVEQCLENSESFDMEVPLVTAENAQKWVRLRGKVRRRSDDTVRLTGILQDITTQHTMEQRLRDRERLLQSITENVSDGIYRTEPGRGLVYANQAFARLFGYDDASQLLEIDPRTLYARPDQENGLLYDVDGVEGRTREVRFQRRDGSTFMGLVGGTVVRDDDGNVEHVDGVIADISDLKRRERILQGERDRFETLFETLLQESEQ